MVMLETDFKLLQKTVGKKFTKKELEETLFDLGMELEEVEGNNIKIDITAERPDMVSTRGLARVLRAYYGLKNPRYYAKKPLKDFKVLINPEVKKVRPFTACAIVKNLKLSEELIEEIIWVQEKLHATFGRNRKKAAIGIYPLEHITLPINYNAAKPEHIKFKPLEASKEMTATQILEQHKTGREYSHLLEGKKVYPYFEDSKGNILSMPPIINSEDTGRVTTKTKEVFIECSGHDLNALKQTLNILVYLLIDMGGEAYQMKLIYDKKIITPNLEPETWKISTKYANKILGSNFSPNQIATLLRKSMHHVKKIGKDIVEFEIPAIRTDIWHDIDVVDDIIRAYGINNLKPKFPKVATEGKITIETEIKKIITELMTGIGFQEIFTLALTSNEDQYEKMNLEEQEHIKLGESVEEKISMVRTWLLPETLKSFMNNRNREYPQKLFEVSDVIIPDTTKDVLSKNVTKMSCAIADTNTDYTKIKQVLVYLLEKFGYTPKFEVTKHESFIEGRTAKVIVNNKTIGIIGELHPQVITNWGLEVPIAGFEIEVLK